MSWYHYFSSRLLHLDILLGCCVRPIRPRSIQAYRKAVYSHLLVSGPRFSCSSPEVCDGNDHGCSLGVGGTCGVSATVFWILVGNFSSAAGKEKDDDAPVVEAHDDKAKDETAAEE
jgi:hypothetical protein